ncbi:MAG: MFS transporter [Thermoleophilia bacterium]
MVLATATAAQTAFSLVTFALPSIGPEIADEFDLSLAFMGVVLAASLLGTGLALYPAGVAVGRWGGRTVMLAGTAISTAGLFGAAFAPSAPVLVAMLFLSGVGTAAVPIASIGAVFDVFPIDRRAWALGVRQMGVPLARILGAILLPALDHVGGSRAALLLCAAATVSFGALFAVVGAGGAPSASADGRRPRARLAPLLAIPGMRRLLTVSFFYVLALQATLVFLVPAARDAGLSDLASNAAFFLLQISAAAARVVWGRIADRGAGRRRARTLVETGIAATAGALVFALALHAGTALTLVAAAGIAFGTMGWNAIVYATAGERAGPALAAQAVSVQATLVFSVSAVSTPGLGASRAPSAGTSSGA